MPRVLCARCFERGWNRPANLANDALRYFGKHLCDECVQDESEAAAEQQSTFRDAPWTFAKNH